MALDNQPRVWVTQELPSLDYSKAERFGEVTFLTHREMSTARNSIANAGLVEEITEKLNEKFNHNIDYVVFSGSPAVAAAVFLYLGTKGVAKIRLLKWSNRDMCYNVIEIEVPHE